MLPAPAHVNQLTAGTKFPDGRPSGPYDCAVSSGRMALDAWSRGGLRPSTTAFRAAQHDQDHNGIGLDDIAAAWRGFGVRFDYGSHSWRDVYARLVAGDGATIPGHYGNMGSWSAQPSFTGPHMMYLQRTAPGGILTDDPLRSSAVVIPTATIQRFYGGSAGWGHGVYTGAGAGDTTGGGGAYSGANLAAWLGKQPTDLLTADDVARIMRDGYGIRDKHPGDPAYDMIAAGFTPYIGKPISSVPGTIGGISIPDIPGAIASAAAELGGAIGDAAVGVVVNVMIAGSIIGLTYMGLKAILTSPASIGRG